MKRKLFVFCFLFYFIFSGLGLREAAAREAARFIFLFIGDGMGQNQYQAAKERGFTGNIDLLPVKGAITTHSLSGITDSAAAGTALAAGHKTKNGVLGMANSKNLESVLERAQKNGMKTGVISTMTLNHATPAAFYAHVPDRGNYYEIGLHLITSKIDYFGGGGLTRERGRKNDQENLFALAEKAGYKVFRKGKIPDVKLLKNKRVISVNPVLRSDFCMRYAEKSGPGARKLSEFVREAILILGDNEKGFVIVVEGGNIDYACHDHEFERAMREVSDFNDSLAPALEFYREHGGETLIIVTADHETGGLKITPEISWSTRGHSNAAVPVFANISLDKVKDNTDIAKLIFEEIGR